MDTLPDEILCCIFDNFRKTDGLYLPLVCTRFRKLYTRTITKEEVSLSFFRRAAKGDYDCENLVKRATKYRIIGKCQEYYDYFRKRTNSVYKYKYSSNEYIRHGNRDPVTFQQFVQLAYRILKNIETEGGKVDFTDYITLQSNTDFSNIMGNRNGHIPSEAAKYIINILQDIPPATNIFHYQYIKIAASVTNEHPLNVSHNPPLVDYMFSYCKLEYVKFSLNYLPFRSDIYNLANIVTSSRFPKIFEMLKNENKRAIMDSLFSRFEEDRYSPFEKHAIIQTLIKNAKYMMFGIHAPTNLDVLKAFCDYHGDDEVLSGKYLKLNKINVEEFREFIIYIKEKQVFPKIKLDRTRLSLRKRSILSDLGICYTLDEIKYLLIYECATDSSLDSIKKDVKKYAPEDLELDLGSTSLSVFRRLNFIKYEYDVDNTIREFLVSGKKVTSHIANKINYLIENYEISEETLSLEW